MPKTPTQRQLLLRIYRNMKSRVEGKGSYDRSKHIWHGKEILPQDEFLEFGLGNRPFNRLYRAWVASGCLQPLIPSPDRMDTNKGYTKDNIRWCSLSENCSKASKRQPYSISEATLAAEFAFRRFVEDIQQIQRRGIKQ